MSEYVPPEAIPCAVHAIDRFFNEARPYYLAVKEARKKPAVSCKNLLCAAQSALKGLRKEVEEILSQAKFCDLTKEEDVKSLEERVYKYLHHDRLRDILNESIGKIGSCRKILQQNLEGKASGLPILNRIGAKSRNKRRKVALGVAASIALLEKQLDELSEKQVRCLAAGTGFCASELGEILNCLKAGCSKETLEGLLERAQTEFEERKKRILKHTQQIASTISDLQLVFDLPDEDR
jgi:hypothetical protein